MTRVRLIVAASFAIAFAAGVAAGVASSLAAGARTDTGEAIGADDPKHPEKASERRPREHRSWLARELNLTPEQHQKMRDIWEGALAHSRRASREDRRALREEREERFMEMLSEEQRQQYDELVRWYEESMEAIEAERRKRFEKAVEQTKDILDEEQREKYEEILKERSGRRGGEPGDGPPSRQWGRQRPRSDE